MTIKLYELHQYTDTKRWYITRLESISEYGSIQRIVISETWKTKALALVSSYR